MTVKEFGGISFLVIVSAWIVSAAETGLTVLVPFDKDVADLQRHFAFVGQPREFAGRRFYTASEGGREFKVVVSKAGLQETAVTCDAAVMKFGATRILSVGVAGALSDRYAAGDVVVVTNIVCHDRGSYREPEGYVCGGGPGTAVRTDPLLDDFLRRITVILTNSSTTHYADALASGNSFIASDVRRASLARESGAGLVDMNSAGLAASCESLRVPFCVVRVVSDRADANARPDFDRFVSDRSQMRSFLDAVAAALKETLKEER